MRYTCISGTAYERGKAHGRQFKKEIKRMVHDSKLSLRNDVDSFSLRPPSDEELLTLVRAGLPYAVEFAPDLVEEVKGIADGSGLDFEEVLLLNYFLDLSVLCCEQLHSQLLRSGCTCFGVAGSATAHDCVYIGQNYDWSTLRPGVALMKIESPSSPVILCLTATGLVGCAGMNSEGLGIVINGLIPMDCRPGVPYTFVLRKALRQVNVAKAIDVILEAHRSSGISYLLADRSGEILCLETTAGDSEVIYALDDYIGHTNHYTHPRLAVYDSTVRGAREGDSYVRWSRINKMLRRRLGSIQLKDLMEFMRDHVGCPDSICNHPSTIASLIMELRGLSLWITDGNPCEKGYEKFELVLA